MKTTTIFSLLIIFCLKIQAQTVIEGSVLDAQGKSGDAIVTVTAKGYSSVLAFAETDNKGDYRLEVNSQSDSLKKRYYNLRKLKFMPRKYDKTVILLTILLAHINSKATAL